MPRGLPWFPFYATDWLADARVRALTFEERGLYIELLAWQWREGAIYDDDDVRPAGQHLEALLGVTPGSPQACSLAVVVEAFFPNVNGAGSRRNPRLEKIRLEQEAARLAQSLGGKSGREKQLHSPRPTPGQPRAKPKACLVEVEVDSDSEVTTKPSAPKTARVGWLTPFEQAWQRQYGGEPTYGALAKYLAPLTKAHPVGDVLEHWERYLEHTDGQYASPARFSSTYGEWGKRQREPEGVPDMYLTLEEQEARRAKLHAPKGVEAVGDILHRVLP